MNKKFKQLMVGIAALIIGIWILAKIPFNQTIDHQINANIYKNGKIIGASTVSIKGEKTNYILAQEDNFFGEFSISCMGNHNKDAPQASIEWNKEENVQHIRYFKPGNIILAEDMGLVPYLLINEDMTKFALMTTDGRVVATSDELQSLYTKHITWHEDTTSTSILEINNIPPIS